MQYSEHLNSGLVWYSDSPEFKGSNKIATNLLKTILMQDRWTQWLCGCYDSHYHTNWYFCLRHLSKIRGECILVALLKVHKRMNKTLPLKNLKLVSKLKPHKKSDRQTIKRLSFS